MADLKTVLVDVIDDYLHLNYGYLSGSKEDGYTFDGPFHPMELAELLVPVITSERGF